ncbi:myb-related protein 306 isoform X1 [Iris pallida]|uniref:Myb-related protein 306 isoform X1 n=1 Tax=Iris pallida TaxID=29817 RepID=A0AAX6F3Q7_IRIPA|nr:myb-related protein 306 isoform X1 [Iris pallida]
MRSSPKANAAAAASLDLQQQQCANINAPISLQEELEYSLLSYDNLGGGGGIGWEKSSADSSAMVTDEYEAKPRPEPQQAPPLCMLEKWLLMRPRGKGKASWSYQTPLCSNGCGCFCKNA